MKRVCLVGLLAGIGMTGQIAFAAALAVRVVGLDGAAVADAAVVADPMAKAIPNKRASAIVEQRDRELMPYLTIVRSGTAIEFPNRDPIKHHLYSFSPAKPFEIKLYAGKPMQPVIFDKPGEVALGCNIHDWMEAYVYVVDSPYFAKTGASGEATLEGIPPGQYQVRLWHPRLKRPLAPRQLTLSDDSHKLDLVLDVAPRIAKVKPPADASQY